MTCRAGRALPVVKKMGKNQDGGFNRCAETGFVLNPRDWPLIPQHSYVWAEWQVVMSQFSKLELFALMG